ncbi:MAG: serine/threonine protein kinase [Planctomycetota bacterium]|nr:MAG: serine/threonine protein kinase [Planctomycetota bacterium]
MPPAKASPATRSSAASPAPAPSSSKPSSPRPCARKGSSSLRVPSLAWLGSSPPRSPPGGRSRSFSRAPDPRPPSASRPTSPSVCAPAGAGFPASTRPTGVPSCPRCAPCSSRRQRRGREVLAGDAAGNCARLGRRRAAASTAGFGKTRRGRTVSEGAEAHAAVPEVPGYRLLEAIGQGGSGVVYRAEGRDELARPCAVKVFPPAQRSAYERELATLRGIERVRAAAGSRDLVETIAAGEVEGSGYVVMEYVRGGTLEERVRAGGPLPVREAVAALRPVLQGLRLLHREGILHKDVKPANVLLDDEGRTKLGDFGLARPLDAPVSSAGTPGFCAPELYAGRGAETGDERLDVYSAAATLYYVLTGEVPLPGRPDVFLLERRRVPRPLQEVLFAALAEDPAQRLPSATALEERLVAWSEGRLPARTPGRRRVPLLVGLVALGLAAGALASAFVPGLAPPWADPPPSLLWDGASLALAGPPVRWEGGRLRVAGRGTAHALAGSPVATARDVEGRLLAAVGPDGELAVVDLRAPRVLLRRPGPQGVSAPLLCSVAVDERRVARALVGTAPGGSERLEVFDLESGELVRVEEDARGACALALLPGGHLLFGRPDGTVLVSGPGSGSPLGSAGERTVRLFDEELVALACDPTAEQVYAVGLDRGSEAGDGARSGVRLRLKVVDLASLRAGRPRVLRAAPATGIVAALGGGARPAGGR